MLTRFLHAKPWMLFLLIYGLPSFVQLVVLSYFSGGNPEGADYFAQRTEYLPLVLLVNFTLLFTWYYAIAIKLQALVPRGFNFRVSQFKIFFAPAMLLIPATAVVFTVSPDSGKSLLAMVASVITLNMFAICGLFWCINFVAKTLKTAELKRKVRFNEYVSEFFLFLFYPIGIWFLQPRINKLARQLEVETPGGFAQA